MAIETYPICSTCKSKLDVDFETGYEVWTCPNGHNPPEFLAVPVDVNELYIYDETDNYFCDYCDAQLVTDNLPVGDWYCPNCGKAELST